MGRSRMVDDGFWDDPELSEITLEQRTALLLFLTCPQSNVIGVYRVIWRQVGAGAGWTQDQLLQVARDLQKKGVVAIEEASGWLWVKVWWKHNSIRAAFVGNVQKKAKDELHKVPDYWTDQVMTWLIDNGYEAPPQPLPSPSQGAGGNLTPTSTPISNHHHRVVVGEIDEFVEAAAWEAGSSVRSPSGFRSRVRSRIETEGASADDMATLARWRAWREQQQREVSAAEREQQAAAAQKKANDQKRHAIESFLDALDAQGRADIDRQFGDWLASHNQGHVLSAFRRVGITESPMVFALFAEFYDHHHQETA